jgi:starch synthase
MRILMVGSEAVPWAKTGGLADVLGALPRALARQGHQVDVLIPRYRGISAGQAVGRVSVSLGGRTADAPLFEAGTDGARVLFVDQPEYFDRPALYGDGNGDYADNAFRFAFLGRAALEWAARVEHRYHVIHAHDWQAGLVPVMLATTFANHAVLSGTPTVFTIHNLAYQGTFAAHLLPWLGLGWDLMRIDALEFWGGFSFLKGGIVFSRMITTVSPRYAQEVQTPEFGSGLDGILRARSGDLVGILNGIDYDQWDPERDVHLPQPYSASNLRGKEAVKRAVLEALGIATDEASVARPLVGMVSRMVDQKGFDLVAALADDLPRIDASFVVLGTGDRRYEEMWTGLAARHRNRIGARIGFDESLAHLIEGGADLFLMPSRFEPCGLNQMYSLRYGTVPVVRATGGLYDTVRNYDPRTREGTGFTFDEYSPRALLGTLRWALDMYKDRDTWRRIQQAGMREDNSWDARARNYVSVYERALA